jgi:hypothetical protein
VNGILADRITRLDARVEDASATAELEALREPRRALCEEVLSMNLAIDRPSGKKKQFLYEMTGLKKH